MLKKVFVDELGFDRMFDRGPSWSWEDQWDQPNSDNPNTDWGENKEKKDNLDSNFQKAMLEERRKRKEIEGELQKYRELEEKEKEKKQKEKGNFEEILKDKEKKILELTEKASNWDKYQLEKEESLTQSYETLVTEISPEVLKDYEDIYSELSLEKKVKFLEKIKTDTTKVIPNISTPESGWANQKKIEKGSKEDLQLQLKTLESIPVWQRSTTESLKIMDLMKQIYHLK